MKFKFMQKLVQKPRKKILRICQFASAFLASRPPSAVDDAKMEEEGGLAKCPFVVERPPQGGGSGRTEFPGESAQQHKEVPKMVDNRAIYEEMVSKLEEIFRRYFFRRFDHFALANVQSTHCARKRHRMILGTKQMLAEMMEHWEGEYRRQYGRKGEGGDDDGIGTFMDTYFGTIWDFLSESAEILEDTMKIGREKMKGEKRKRHSLYGPLTSTMLTTDDGDMPMGGGGGAEDDGQQNVFNLELEGDNIFGWRPRMKMASGARMARGGTRPKSAICYF